MSEQLRLAEHAMTTLLDMEQVAARLSLPLASVYSLARRRLIPAVKVGRLWRMDPQRLEAWIAAGGQTLSDDWREAA